MTAITLSIIGCGKVGKTVGRLWAEKGLFQVQDVMNRSLTNARNAVAFLGAGTPVTEMHQLRPAQLYLIATPDAQIAACAQGLANCGLIDQTTVLFHLSGALPSSVLVPVPRLGGGVASVHPVKSFADPETSVATFKGTWCGVEGDAAAVTLLTDAFRAIGGVIFPIDAGNKAIYHSGSVIVCNYLNALLETGLKAYEKGGLPRSTALQVMEPLVRGTLDNIFSRGPAAALTGPIARGDLGVVAGQVEALDAWNPELGQLYRALGRVALELASLGEGGAQGEVLERLQALLAQRGSGSAG